MTIDTSVVMIWQKALIVCSSQLDIKQWGYVKSTNSNTRIYLPINALPVSVVMNDENTVANDLSISTCSYTSGSFVVYGSRRDGNTVIWGHWVAVCT